MHSVPDFFQNRINEAQQNQSKYRLCLRGYAKNKLQHIPNSIFSLSYIKELDVSHNQLTSLPQALIQNTSLCHINIAFNPLKSIPKRSGLVIDSSQFLQFQAEICLDHIIGLCFHKDDLRYLDEWLGQGGIFHHIEVLEFTNCALGVLPEVVSMLPHLTRLGLSKNKITKIPKSMGQLQSLTELYLSNNRLTELSEFIGHLRKLTKLYIWGNKLTKLPESIGQLQNLTELYLYQNQLTELPESIGQLQELTELYLNNNQLVEVPKSLGTLKKLIAIYMWDNQLTEVPKSICQLKNLTKLYLSHNQLTKLPESIGQLYNLTELHLNKNRLTELPESIGQLQNLTQLNLSANNLIKLPKSIGQLQSLTKLDLSFNNLTKLPESIGQLQNLMVLDLKNLYLTGIPKYSDELEEPSNRNHYPYQLTKLPKSIGQLQNLIKLDLSAHNFTDIPESIAKLQKLTVLSFDNNPIESPPPAIIKQGIGAIRNYFKQLKEQGEHYLHEARILIVGEGGAGKTTLQEKLLNPDYILPQNGEVSTLGIQIKNNWSFPYHANPDINFKAHLWDFGGQEIQYMTHQFFLRDRSFYILVADDRRQDSNFDYWFKAINTFAKGCPVLVVLNEKNSKVVTNFDLKRYQSIYPQLDIEQFSIDLKHDRDRLLRLTEKIQARVSRLNHIGEILPAFWIPVRAELAQRRKEHHISFAEFCVIGAKYGIDNEDDMLAVSRYLDTLGLIIHFSDDSGLNDFVILDPQWVVKAIYAVLEDETVQKNQGIMDQAWIFAHWKKDEHRLDECGKLLNLMKRDKFEICYQIKDSNPAQFMVPQLLPSVRPDYPWHEKHNLQFRFSYPFMPKGIMARLIVRLNEYIAEEAQQPLIWKRGMVLIDKNMWAEIIQSEDASTGTEVINIRISGQSSGQKDMLTFVRRELNYIHQHSFPNMQVNEGIPCCGTICGQNESPKFFEYAELEKLINNKRGHIYCANCDEDIALKQLLEGVVDDNSKHRIESGQDLAELAHHPGRAYDDAQHDDEHEGVIDLVERLLKAAKGQHVIHNHVSQTMEINISIQVKNEIMMELGGQLETLKEDLLDDMTDEKARTRLEKEFRKVEKASADIEALTSPEQAKQKKGALNRIKKFIENLHDTATTAGKAVKTVEGGLNTAKDLAKLYNKLAPWAGLPVLPEKLLK